MEAVERTVGVQTDEKHCELHREARHSFWVIKELEIVDVSHLAELQAGLDVLPPIGVLCRTRQVFIE